MGTLTTDCPRLDSHCPHKLATSCRLTSTPNCCACADERAHSRTYAVYIDGVGFVQRGTRWQAYCWFCKEFWNNRLAATDPPLDTSQTRIPEIPDQSAFLQRWFEFHQGYRIVHDADGAESRIAVIGEPLKDVSPGFLPRTLDQLRAGRANDARRPENRFQRRRLSSDENRPQEPQQSIEDALDNLLEEASDEEEALDGATEATEAHEEQIAASMPRLRRDSTGLPPPLSRVEAVAQRARERLTRVFGTREQIDQDDYESPLASVFGRAEQRYREAESRRRTGDTVAPPLDTLPTNERYQIEQQILWGVLQDSRRTSDDSFAELDALRATTPRPTQRSTPSVDNFLAELDGREVDQLSLASSSAASTVPTRAPIASSITTTSTTATSSSASTFSSLSPGIRESIDRLNAELERLRLATAGTLPSSSSDADPSTPLTTLPRRPLIPVPELDMDKQNRPPPMDEKDMTKTLSCQVCYSQLADIALLPCGHMVLCGWCADTLIPLKYAQHHIPARTSARCPMCRKSVKQRFKIHM